MTGVRNITLEYTLCSKLQYPSLFVCLKGKGGRVQEKTLHWNIIQIGIFYENIMKNNFSFSLMTKPG